MQRRKRVFLLFLPDKNNRSRDTGRKAHHTPVHLERVCGGLQVLRSNRTLGGQVVVGKPALAQPEQSPQPSLRPITQSLTPTSVPTADFISSKSLNTGMHRISLVCCHFSIV